jgi:hypothetical protein
MSEKAFIEDLKRSAKKMDKSAFVWKTNDGFSLGIPDLVMVFLGNTYFIEAKSALQASKRKGSILHHPFSGPQISVLRQIVTAGGCALGIVRTAPGVAYILNPFKIPARGNFDFESLEGWGVRVTKDDQQKVWRIFEWPKKLNLPL